jgi:hypothetical protein
VRTTLNIDDDLLRQLKREAHRSQTPLRQLVNTALRRGIGEPALRRGKTAYSCPTFSMGAPQIGLDKALTLAASLEDSEVLRELELRK